MRQDWCQVEKKTNQNAVQRWSFNCECDSACAVRKRSSVIENLKPETRELTAGVQYEIIIEFRSDVAKPIFEPQLVVGVPAFLVVGDHLRSGFSAAPLNIQYVAARYALDEKVPGRPVHEDATTFHTM